MKRVSFICGAESLLRVEALAAEKDTNVSHLIRMAIDQYLASDGGAGK